MASSALKASRDKRAFTRTAEPKGQTAATIKPTHAPERDKHARLPAFVPPELATLVTAPPEGDHWFNEIKYDGYRAIAAVAGGRVRIFTRSGQDWTAKFQQVADALSGLRVKSALLDGEIVALDGNGRSSFARLQQGLKAGTFPLTYYVFDLLELDGRSTRNEPLSRRKEMLEKLLGRAPEGIRYSGHVVGHGNEVLAKACRMGLEGIVAKRSDAPYISKRSKSWLKVKCTGNDEFVIGGYRLSDKKGRPFSSLLIGEFDGKELHYRGRVGTGFDEGTLKDLAARFKKLSRKTSPFVEVPAAIARDVRWVEPRLVAQIAFTERTRDDILRHPAFEGLRGDKPSRQVQSRTSHAMKTKTAVASDRDSAIAGVTLTNPGKVFFPEAQITKEQLARYMLAVSEPMLQHVRGRLVSLVRCPEGTDGERFFQKHPGKGMPSQFTGVPVEESGGKDATYMMLNEPAALVAAAQMGALEIHIWGSRYKKLEYPDRLVFDLDPDTGLAFADVRAAARDIRDLLKEAGLASFPLVTGGKGIHVVAPLDASQDWQVVKSFAKGVADKLAANEPARFVATMSKAKRKGRIFIDYLRNERGATAIAPYSPRARANATVAVPVSWTELGRIEAANAFTIPAVERRLKQKKKADPWKDYSGIRQRIGRKALDFFT
jgi:bifunctional non-homologous end joining protein LigD